MPRPSPFRYFFTSPVIIRLAVMLYIRFLLSLRNEEDLLHSMELLCQRPKHHRLRHRTSLGTGQMKGPLVLQEA